MEPSSSNIKENIPFSEKTFEAVQQLAQILNVDFTPSQIAVCINLIERGVSYKALANTILCFSKQAVYLLKMCRQSHRLKQAMSDESLFGGHEVSPVPFILDSSNLPAHASTSDDDYRRQNVEDSDGEESMSSDVSPGSLKGEWNSRDSWNVDDEESMSDFDCSVSVNSRRQKERNSSVSGSRSLQFDIEAVRMEAFPFLRDENHGINPTDEAEILADEANDDNDLDNEESSTVSRQHYHSDNDLPMHMNASASGSSSVVAYSESDLIGPSVRDVAFNSPTVFSAEDSSAFSFSRQRSTSVTPQTTAEGNNENLPKRKTVSKRKLNSGVISSTKPPVKLPTKTRLTLCIKKWSLGAAWKWNAGDENCGICRMPFEACCTDCKTPGDDCPLALGTCKHSFHMHCIVKWTETQNTPRPQCPLCRQEWKFATE
uniref:Anaphase-promoting complex subunit 11 n=1 Tax=Syphacia muris TaxID=451379 RepID=A0A0N5ADU8_9BILA